MISAALSAGPWPGGEANAFAHTPGVDVGFRSCAWLLVGHPPKLLYFGTSFQVVPVLYCFPRVCCYDSRVNFCMPLFDLL
jgi:hypothetical protein